MNPIAPLITVTGIDHFTDVDELKRIVRPGVEVGILVTVDREGRTRYPDTLAIDLFTKELTGRCALHICGRRARVNLVNHVYDRWVERARRVQVNGRIELTEIREICALFPDREIITQHCTANYELAEADTARNHALLIDSSGGRGLSPAAGWVVPQTTKPVGFAGGLGPDNLAQQMRLINLVSAPGWWVDMEGKLRDAQDHFSVELAKRAVQAVFGAV